MWVEFVVGSLLCSERFFSGYSGFPLSSKTNTSKFQFDLDVRNFNHEHLARVIAQALPVLDVKVTFTFTFAFRNNPNNISAVQSIVNDFVEVRRRFPFSIDSCTLLRPRSLRQLRLQNYHSVTFMPTATSRDDRVIVGWN